MGKCHSKRRVPSYYNYGTYNWVTDHRQLTHREKCKLLFFIRDGPEDEVIQYFKANLHALSCMFWFEIFQLKTDKKATCACSRNLELCYASGIGKDELTKRLEIAITATSCPHVILLRNGINVNVGQDIAYSELSKKCNITIPEVAYRNSLKQTAGVHWIHLAVIYGKMKTVRDILPLTVQHNATDYLFTEKHSISPVSLALCHQNIEMALMIMKYHKSSVFRTALQVEMPRGYTPTPINIALWVNDFKAFKTIYDKVFASCQRMVYNSDTFNFWADKVMECMQNGETEMADILLSVRIGVVAYIQLFKKIHQAGSYWISEKLFSNRDFHKELQTTDKYIKRLLDDVMIRAVLTGDPNTVQTFLSNGFDANTQFRTTNILGLSKAFSYDGVSTVLRSANATETPSPDVAFLIEALSFRMFSGTDFNSSISPLRYIHRLFEVGHDFGSPRIENSVLNIWSYRCHNSKNEFEDVFNYLLLRGCDPTIVAHDIVKSGNGRGRFEMLLFHLVTTNTCIDIGKMVKQYVTGFSNNNDIPYFGIPATQKKAASLLYILEEVVESSLNSSAYGYIQRTFFKYEPNAVRNFVSVWVRSPEEPKTLKSICRHKLRMHFRGFRFFLYLQCEKERIPSPILDYLQMGDCLHQMFKKEKEKLEKLLEVSKQVKTMLNIHLP